MSTFKYVLQKEFQQIRRNPTIVRMMLAVPIIQLIVLPFAADYEIKQLNLAVVDQDHSSYSRELIGQMTASGYFQLANYSSNFNEAMGAVERNEADLILEIPAHFERDLVREDGATLALHANAINQVKGGLSQLYAGQIIRRFNNQIRSEWVQWPRYSPVEMVKIEPQLWFNPHINYHLFMVPGILAVLITMVGSFLASMNIVQEKEAGTIEQINVTPIKKYQFLLGKMIPFWVMGMFSLTLGLVIAYVVYGIVSVGPLWVIYAFSAFYLAAILGIGLLISTFADNQQQATFVSFFFVMIFILMSGLYTPVESMPDWAKVIAYANPVTYMIQVVRGVMIKGAGFMDILPFVGIIGAFGIFFNALAVWRYRKTV
ncbi:MAG: ABC transporter permease [Lewinellaceae bacterium]|nr:ABC transporter permease [Saprospiraceae bacterium]MCB9268040.1 ABC transporter permease [Lewinellaceae bacterium]HPQ98632.1 ABC transporter permease [Saprospiraceae bacterium]